MVEDKVWQVAIGDHSGWTFNWRRSCRSLSVKARCQVARSAANLQRDHRARCETVSLATNPVRDEESISLD